MNPLPLVLIGAAGLLLWLSRRAASKNAVVTAVATTGSPQQVQGPPSPEVWVIHVTYVFSDGSTMPDQYRVSRDVATSPQLPSIVSAIASAFIGETRGQIESRIPVPNNQRGPEGAF
jgi:hypothetical protein